MSKEPRYVDNPFDDDDGPDLSTNGIQNLWAIKEAQRICRRPSRPFHSMKEKRKWIQIDKKITRGTVGKAWVENCFQWAKEQNKDRLIILMPAVASLILNMARMSDWLQARADDEGVATTDHRDLAQDGF